MPTYILLSTLTDEGAATLKYKPDRLLEVNAEIMAGAPPMSNEAGKRPAQETGL